MLNLEQVKLLETKVANTIEYVQRVTGENAALRKKIDANQKRIDELEVLVSRFNEEQGRIEDGILSALDRLNQFEDAIEKSLSARSRETKPSVSSTKKSAEHSNTIDPDTSIKPENGELEIF